MAATRQGTAVILGGTSGIGRALAERLAGEGMSVVISGRDAARAQAVAAEIGPSVSGIAVDLAAPATLREALSGVGEVDALIVAAIERDANTVKDYNVESATRLAVLKLVGYTEAVHVLSDRLTASASIVLFGGLAMLRPYPGSTTVTTVNGGISSMIRTLANELAPVRVNAVHPGIVGDSPEWASKDTSMVAQRTPIGRTVTMDEIVDATLFLVDCGGVNAQNLVVDGGVLVR